MRVTMTNTHSRSELKNTELCMYLKLSRMVILNVYFFYILQEYYKILNTCYRIIKFWLGQSIWKSFASLMLYIKFYELFCVVCSSYMGFCKFYTLTTSVSLIFWNLISLFSELRCVTWKNMFHKHQYEFYTLWLRNVCYFNILR